MSFTFFQKEEKIDRITKLVLVFLIGILSGHPNGEGEVGAVGAFNENLWFVFFCRILVAFCKQRVTTLQHKATRNDSAVQKGPITSGALEAYLTLKRILCLRDVHK